MGKNQSCKQRYVQNEGEQVAVTEEVYLEYKRPLWREHKRMEREKRCRDENGNRCMEDCRLCPKDRTGAPLSLEQFAEDGLEMPAPLDIEEQAVNGLLYEALHIALSNLEPENQMIAELFAAGLSERAIGDRVGLSQKGVSKRKAKIFAQLRVLLQDWQ